MNQISILNLLLRMTARSTHIYKTANVNFLILGNLICTKKFGGNTIGIIWMICRLDDHFQLIQRLEVQALWWKMSKFFKQLVRRLQTLQE
jgi:hypothetical protein